MLKETVLQNKEENGKVPFSYQDDVLRNLSNVLDYRQSLNVPNVLSNAYKDKITALRYYTHAR